MKIVYLQDSLAVAAGTERVITDKANYLAENLKHDVYLVTNQQCGRPLAFTLSDKITHIDLNIPASRRYGYSTIKRAFLYQKFYFEKKRKLTKLLRSLQADIVISTLGDELDFLYKVNDGSKKIVEFHLTRDMARNIHMLRQKGIAYRPLAAWRTRRLHTALKRVDAFVVLTHQEAARWEGIRSPLVIGNFLSFLPPSAAACEKKQVISVGRLVYEKGYDLLIRSWKIVTEKHPDWQLVIYYGSGVLKDQLDALIEQLGLKSSLSIKPPVQNIVDKYLDSSIYVMSSRKEPFGMVLIEAMACGLPVIAYDCPDGPAEIITPGEDGFLVKNEDIEKMAEKIILLIEDEKLRKELGENARKNVQRFAADVIMQKWEDLFTKLKNTQ